MIVPADKYQRTEQMTMWKSFRLTKICKFVYRHESKIKCYENKDMEILCKYCDRFKRFFNVEMYGYAEKHRKAVVDNNARARQWLCLH